MSLSREDIVRLVAEHEAACRRQSPERDWRGNPVGTVTPAEDMPAAPVEPPAPDPAQSDAGEGDVAAQLDAGDGIEAAPSDAGDGDDAPGDVLT